ncbi:MAG: glycogen debranching enzyme GlgX, partial [Niastella sp.]
KDDNYTKDVARSLGIYLNGADLDMTGPMGERITDDNFYIIFNSTPDPVQYKLPSANYAESWTEVINTVQETINPGETTYNAGDTITAEGRSIILLHNANAQEE